MFIFRFTIQTLCAKWKRVLIFIGLTALLCVIAGLLGQYFLSGGGKIDPITILVVDEDHSMESMLVYNMVSNLEDYKELLVFEQMEADAAVDALKANKASAVVTIPKGFTENVKNGRNLPFTISYNLSTPIKSAFIRYYADAFTRMLTASQTGVYAALDYAREYGDQAQYAAMFQTINMRFLSTVLNRMQMLTIYEVSVTGTSGAFQYYATHAYIFIMMAGLLLFTDLLQYNLSKRNLLKLGLTGVGSIRIVLGTAVGVFSLLLLVSILFGGLGFAAAAYLHLELPMQVDWILPSAVFLMLICLGIMGTLLALLFQRMFTAGIFISLFSLVSLVLSGGIIPLDFFADKIQMAGKCTPQYWLARLLNSSFGGQADYGALLAVCAYAGAAFILAVWVCRRRMKAGDTL